VRPQSLPQHIIERAVRFHNAPPAYRRALVRLDMILSRRFHDAASSTRKIASRHFAASRERLIDAAPKFVDYADARHASFSRPA